WTFIRFDPLGKSKGGSRAAPNDRERRLDASLERGDLLPFLCGRLPRSNLLAERRQLRESLSQIDLVELDRGLAERVAAVLLIVLCLRLLDDLPELRARLLDHLIDADA